MKSSHSSCIFKQIQFNSPKLRYKNTISSITISSTNNNVKFNSNNELLNSTNQAFQNLNEEANKETDEVKSASINTIIKNSFIKENDIPWTGDEDIKTTVLRMLVDKYPPLKVKRESIKYNNAPAPPPSFSSSIKISSNTYVTDDQSKQNNSNLRKEKMDKIRIKNQSRIMNAKDAAIDYFISKQLPEKSEANDDNLDHHKSEQTLPRNIATWDSLVERRIQDAIAAGEFNNLSYHGKPLPIDPNENNPYLDRTEFFMNRLVQRQGAAPAWIEYQKEVDNEIFTYRKRMQENWLRYSLSNGFSPKQPNSNWEKKQSSYYEKLIQKLNSRLRSYNTISPSAVRRSYLNLQTEFNRMYQNIKNEDINEERKKNENDSNIEKKKEKKKEENDDNFWRNFTKSFKWMIGHEF
ncbi:hypothetical protein Glove_541g36 [Diversispora epigaea]|uniref:DnaJ homologue subfamily C member 28 conserved domain-containing protein n=1 Tax=Diversispora epigaea TaxID=1348612 RepID=A0A397GFD9_9GLOM|nr:hypothetical protein Glove_541g36 [Diversispora epigaea]